MPEGPARDARVLGYRHNAAAGALRRARGVTASIELIVEGVANPSLSSLHRGIEDVAANAAT